jgi:transcriptional regulator with XRE-family HTH domain
MRHEEKSAAVRPRIMNAEPWVGGWLRKIRESESEDDQRAVAERLGRDQSYVSRIETGDSAIAADDLPLVLSAYNVTPARFARQVAIHGKAA